MFGTIVVPLDGSKFAERAIDTAAWMAQQTGSPVHLVRVMVAPAPMATDAELLTRNDILAYLNGMSWTLEQRGLSVHAAVLEGSAALAIADYADRVAAALVVMTTHGRSGEARRQLGSVAAVVMHHASCPVLLVRGIGRATEARHTRPFGHILLAVDRATPEARVQELARSLETLGRPRVRIMRGTGLDPQAILDTATAQNADLIMLGTSWRTGATTTPDTLTEALLRDSTLPILVVGET